MVEIAAGGLGAILTLLTLTWIASLFLRDVSIVDIVWGLGFILAAWWYASVGGAGTPRAVVIPWLVTMWGLRLSTYLLWRNWGRGEDARYREMRSRRGPRFAWSSLFLVFWLQGIVLWIVSLPLAAAVTAASPSRLTWMDGAGLVLYLCGLGFESVGDWQLARFRSDPANRGTVLRTGLWRYTRHPNYFGDALVWWGLSMFALATGAVWPLVSPVLMTVLLMKVSGVTLLERSLVNAKPGYREYVESTSAFVPWFPRPG